ncbi:MAG: ATP-dependent nuclease [Acidimicrobiales bacterium]
MSSIDDTLSNVAVNVTDAVETGLAAKGTGVRGAAMVAMLRYLADHRKRSMVFAVEEPEAFLHPAAQEDLRDDLEGLGERPDVTLLVTTHSPFVVSRDAKARVTALAKDPEGRTLVTGVAQGDEPHASLLGGLFRDAILADVLERARVPGDAKGVVVVEGRTDAEYLRIAARVSGPPDLLDGLHVAAGQAPRWRSPRRSSPGPRRPDRSSSSSTTTSPAAMPVAS